MQKICERNGIQRDIDQKEIEDFASLVMAIFWGAIMLKHGIHQR